MYKLLIISFLLLPISFLALAQKDFTEFENRLFIKEAKKSKENPQVAKDTLPYRLLKPLNYDKNKKYPLVVFFHGAGERGKDNITPLTHIAPLFLDSLNRLNYPCFVIVPQCPKEFRWVATDWKLPAHTQPGEPSKPMYLFMKLLDDLAKEFSLDEKRLYVTGLSMGGFATWDIIARFPSKFACAVPICGGADEKTAEKIKNIPIWAFHGALDKVVIPERSRNIIKAIQEKGGSPKYTEFADVYHDSWKRAYADPELIKWIFEQKRK
jgi:predicted peptidase